MFADKKQQTTGESMKTVTVSEMIKIIREKTVGTSNVTVDLDSPMDAKGAMRTTGNPFADKKIVKREMLNGMIGYIYANAVNRIADKEGKEHREAKQHPWGDMDERHLFRIHRANGKHYLSMRIKNVTVHGFFAPDGSMVNEEEIRKFIPEKKKSSTQVDLNGEVIPRDFGMENIRAIRAFGEEYLISTHPLIIETLAEKVRVVETEIVEA